MLDELEMNSTRRAICAIGRRMHERGYVAGADGNISVRTAKDRLLVTPSGIALGELEPDMLLELGRSGRVNDSPCGLSPTSELDMHLEIYSTRPDVFAAIHAHPVHATALSIPYFDLRSPVLPESLLAFGRIGVADFAIPTTEAVARMIGPLLPEHDGIIMRRHGTLTLGADLLESYHRLEALEHTCEIIYKASLLGKAIPLDRSDIRKIMDLRKE